MLDAIYKRGSRWFGIWRFVVGLSVLAVIIGTVTNLMESRIGPAVWGVVTFIDGYILGQLLWRRR